MDPFSFIGIVVEALIAAFSSNMYIGVFIIIDFVVIVSLSLLVSFEFALLIGIPLTVIFIITSVFLYFKLD